jgi:anti-sigma factor RsiW
MNPQDNPHFTAYALGELSAEEARALHEELATTPAAAHELEQIEAVTDALRQGAPIPQSRLTHEQRHAVLHPSNLPRRIQPMMPRKPAGRQRPVFWPVMGTVLKMAAVATLTGAAFFAGWSFSPAVKEAAQAAVTPPSVEPVVKPQSPVEKAVSAPAVVAEAPARPKPAVVPQKTGPVPMPPKVVAEVKPASAPVAKEVVVAEKTAPAVSSRASTPAPAPNLGFTMPTGRTAFVSTTKQATDQFSLHPAQLKPAPPKSKGQVFASPQNTNAKPEAKPAKVSDLFIHSWKAEVADCPWNPANRLLRVVIQLPADQAAVLSSDTVFPIEVTFDQAREAVPHAVRAPSGGHRAAQCRHACAVVRVSTERHRQIPRDGGRQVATVRLPNARFTSQAVGPFDSSRLQVIDRGYSLKNAREDFVFETSVVGFGLLLRGEEQLGGLNHDLVLNLAKQAKGADADGERARFIRLVQDAQRVAGL